MEDLTELYQDIILSHHKRPHNEGELVGHTHSSVGHNPLCGDLITVFIREKDGKVEEVAFLGQGCAISRASASIMTSLLKGVPVEEVPAKVREVTEMLTDTDEPEIKLEVQGDLAALSGVRKFPARIKCATLAWHAAEDALAENSADGEK